MLCPWLEGRVQRELARLSSRSHSIGAHLSAYLGFGVLKFGFDTTYECMCTNKLCMSTDYQSIQV